MMDNEVNEKVTYEHYYSMDLNSAGIRDALTRKVLSKISREMVDADERLSSIITGALNIGYESLVNNEYRNKNLSIILEALADTVNTMMESFMVDNGTNLRIVTESEEEPEKGDFDEDIADEIVKEQDGDDGLSSVVTDIIESAIEGSREQMKQAVKLALKVEKDRQDNKYEEKKAEADEFAEIEEEPAGEEGDEKKDEKDDGKDKDENKESDSKDEGSDDKADDSSKEEDVSNPFEEEEKKDEEKKEDSKDEESKTDDQEKSDKGEEFKNPFESILGNFEENYDIAMEKVVMNKLGVTPGEMHNFTNEIMSNLMIDNMKAIYDKYGPESIEMREAQNVYKNNSNKMIENLVKNCIVLESIGIKFDTNIIKYPDAYFEK